MGDADWRERAERAEAALAARTLALEDCRDRLCLSGQALAEARRLLRRWDTATHAWEDGENVHVAFHGSIEGYLANKATRAFLDRTRPDRCCDGQWDEHDEGCPTMRAAPAQAPTSRCEVCDGEVFPSHFEKYPRHQSLAVATEALKNIAHDDYESPAGQLANAALCELDDLGAPTPAPRCLLCSGASKTAGHSWDCPARRGAP